MTIQADVLPAMDAMSESIDSPWKNPRESLKVSNIQPNAEAMLVITWVSKNMAPRVPENSEAMAIDENTGNPTANKCLAEMLS